MRVVFCGTPQFAVPALEALLAAGYDVPLVLAQPDRPVGRKQVFTAPAVKQVAALRDLPVLQPEKLRNNPELEAKMREIAPDAIVVVAYGRIIPPWMLTLPRLGNINVHASLLPKYRGAAPIQWALANGESVTGATTMLLNEGLDTGPMLGQRQISVGDDETAVDLSPRLSKLGSELLLETLTKLASGNAQPVPQNDAAATLAPILTRDDGRVNLSRSAAEIYNRWRGFQPWPGAFAGFRGEKIIFSKLRKAAINGASAPGTLLVNGKQMFFCCGDGAWLEIVEVQPAGKRAMAAEEFLHGQRLTAGERLT
jgi:methionyl-tRNA formyltransferase